VIGAARLLPGQSGIPMREQLCFRLQVWPCFEASGPIRAVRRKRTPPAFGGSWGGVLTGRLVGGAVVRPVPSSNRPFLSTKVQISDGCTSERPGSWLRNKTPAPRLRDRHPFVSTVPVGAFDSSSTCAGGGGHDPLAVLAGYPLSCLVKPRTGSYPSAFLLKQLPRLSADADPLYDATAVIAPRDDSAHLADPMIAVAILDGDRVRGGCRAGHRRLECRGRN
jgi:hypothetical protein